MDHADHVALIRGGVPAPTPESVWADIGAGEGAFTLAVADVLGPGARIIAIDRDAGALRRNAGAVASRFPGTGLTTVVADLEGRLEVPALDGLVAANSLHYVPRDRQVATIRSLADHLRPDAPFILVEYDADRGNPWVPHPLSIRAWKRIAAEGGLQGTTEIGRVPSRFLGAIYAAVSRRSSAETSNSMSPGSV